MGVIFGYSYETQHVSQSTKGTFVLTGVTQNYPYEKT